MKKFVALILALVMCLALAACGGGSASKKAAVDAFNEAAAAFNDASALINENPEVVDDETYNTFLDMSALLNQYNEILSGNEDVDDATYDEMTAWFGDVVTWSNDAKTQIEAAVG